MGQIVDGMATAVGDGGTLPKMSAGLRLEDV